MLHINNQLKIIIIILLAWVIIAQVGYIDKLLTTKDNYIAECEKEIVRLQAMLKEHHTKNSP